MDETPIFLQREAALAALYPDESRPMDGITINFGPDPRIVLAEREAKRLARAEEARRMRMRAEFDIAHPVTEGDRIRQANAEAKRARRQARNLRTR